MITLIAELILPSPMKQIPIVGKLYSYPVPTNRMLLKTWTLDQVMFLETSDWLTLMIHRGPHVRPAGVSASLVLDKLLSHYSHLHILGGPEEVIKTRLTKPHGVDLVSPSVSGSLTIWVGCGIGVWETQYTEKVIQGSILPVALTFLTYGTHFRCGNRKWHRQLCHFQITVKLFHGTKAKKEVEGCAAGRILQDLDF